MAAKKGEKKAEFWLAGVACDVAHPVPPQSTLPSPSRPFSKPYARRAAPLRGRLLFAEQQFYGRRAASSRRSVPDPDAAPTLAPGVSNVS